MANKKINPNLLLVEGKDEVYSIPYFMENYIVWDKDNRPVDIKEFGGVENLLKAGVIEAESKMHGVKAMGIILDADDSFDARWSKVKTQCKRVAADFPEDLPDDGLIFQRSDGLRIGVWIMPNNSNHGMLETFLGDLLTSCNKPIWSFAKKCCDEAIDSKYEGACSDTHREKGRVHTYLAWVDPPGRSLQYSIIQLAFDLKYPPAEKLANWFIKLFQLQPK